MIDQRFAISEFEKLGHQSSEAHALHKELASEIDSELHKSIEPAFRAVADRLRALGHHLTEVAPEYDAKFHSWGYEHHNPDNDQALRIWLHTQLGVISGYLDKAYESNDKA
jgi:hypothetical protein